MKKYSYEKGEHRFDSRGNYLGFFDKYGASLGIGEPFLSWKDWDEAKHVFLIDKLGFSFKEE